MSGANPMIRSSSKSKIAESPTIPAKMKLKLMPRSSSRVKETAPKQTQKKELYGLDIDFLQGLGLGDMIEDSP